MGWGRAYFAVQAIAGALWWVAVAVSAPVRALTLGSLDPVLVAVLDIPLFVVASYLAALGGRWAARVATVWTLVVTMGLALLATVAREAGWGVLLMLGATAGSVAALALVETGRIPIRWIASGPFAFRLARDRHRSAHVAATFGQIAVFWGLALGVVPVLIRLLEVRWRVDLPLPAATVPAGAVLLVLASGLGIWAALAMSLHGGGTPLPVATARRLVVVGPYRSVRNPMAVAGIAQGVSVGLLLGSWLVVVYALAGAVVWHTAVRPLEEADLERRFGTAFRDYRARVRCWVPVRPVPAVRAEAVSGPAPAPHRLRRPRSRLE